MPFFVLGISAIFGGIVAWLLFRPTTQNEGAAAETDKEAKVDALASPGSLSAPVVGISSIPSPGMMSAVGTGIKLNTAGVTATSVAEGNDTVPQRADEGEDRFEQSAAAAQSPTLDRWTADAFMDEDAYVPTVQLSTRVVNDASPDVVNGWVLDDIVSPRDLAGAPLADALGMLETELK